MAASTGEAGQAPEPALEDGAHDAAGDHDLRVGEPIADLAPVPLGLDQARRSQDREVLRGVRLADAELGREGGDVGGAGGEPVEDLQPPWAREALQGLGLEGVISSMGPS